MIQGRTAGGQAFFCRGGFETRPYHNTTKNKDGGAWKPTAT